MEITYWLHCACMRGKMNPRLLNAAAQDKLKTHMCLDKTHMKVIDRLFVQRAVMPHKCFQDCIGHNAWQHKAKSHAAVLTNGTAENVAALALIKTVA